MRKDNNIYLHKIATIVPENCFKQDHILNFMIRISGDSENRNEFLKRVYKNSSIEKRYSVIRDIGSEPSDYTFFSSNGLKVKYPTTMKRNNIYIEKAKSLSVKVVEKLLNSLSNFDKNRITDIITVSCTGFMAPGVDFYVTTEFQLNNSINRYNIGFMGCYAAFPALKLARNICLANPRARVLVLNVELCSLHIQDPWNKDNMVANTIFSDGVSAALVSACDNDSSGSKIILHHFLSSYINNSDDSMVWSIGNSGFLLKLSAYVPGLIKENIKSIVNDLFKRIEITKKDIDIWAIHPGGKRILENIEGALEITKNELSVSYQILKEYGNMSSSTIMFIYERILNDKRNGKIFSAGFGPGLTVESAYLEKVLQ